MADMDMSHEPLLNKTLMDRLNRVPWRCLCIPGLFLFFLGSYTCVQMSDYTRTPLDGIAAFAHVIIFIIGVMTALVGIALCVTWYYMWDKRFMPLAEAEQQRRDMAAARSQEYQRHQQRC